MTQTEIGSFRMVESSERSVPMRIPSWLMVAAAVVMALPFGWGLGVLVAYLIAGSDFGQLPAATVPLGIVAALVFALCPSIKASTRLATMVAGSVVLILFVRLLP